jgi:putative ABC transport system permease protein
VFAIRTLDDTVSTDVARPRFATLLLTMFAAFGLAIGLVGIYGVLAYTIAERTQELGIRRALGATAPGLVRLMLKQGLLPVGVGAVVGLAAAYAARNLIGTQLYGIAPTDALTYVVVAVGVLVSAILACLVPMRRALRVSPLTALRTS